MLMSSLNVQRITVIIILKVHHTTGAWLNFTGVFNNSLQLSDQPPLGPWTITVTAAVSTSVCRIRPTW